MYKYAFDPQALKDFKKLTPKIQKQILGKLEFFLSSPNPLDFAKPLRKHKLGRYRFRIGNYRVVFDVKGEMIIILTLGHRKSIYK